MVTLFYYEDFANKIEAQAEYETISSIALTEKINYKLTVANDGTAQDISIYEEGVMNVTDGGFASGITIYAKTLAANMDGYLYVGSNGSAENVAVYGDAEIDTKGTLSNATIFDKGVVQLFSDGILESSTIATGGRVYSHQSTLYDLTLENNASIAVYGGIADSITVNNGGEVLLNDSAVIQNSVFNAGSSLSLSTGGILSGTFKLSATAKLDANENTGIEFVLPLMESGNDAFIEDFTDITGTPYYFVTVSDTQDSGSYALIGNASSFEEPIYMTCGSYERMLMSVGATGTYHNSVYDVVLDNDTLKVNVSNYETSVSDNTLSWNSINNAENYVLALSDGYFLQEVQLDVTSVDVLGLNGGDYYWWVRNAGEKDNWQEGIDFTLEDSPSGPQMLEATSNQCSDLFFANADSVWESGYVAKNVGCKDGWTGTGNKVFLKGKARITNIFAGSDDKSIIVLNDTANGSALVLDDIFSDAPNTAEQARLAKINTIIAGNNGDIIDLTSQKFSFDGGVSIYGGNGNDVIWANSDENILLGGNGNDNIIGGNGNDIIAGGSGNDTLHGGGGEDIFLFGDNWGQDTVTQLSDENSKVILWFQEDNGTWNDTTLTYTQANNSVSVSGVALSSIELRFGAEEQYTEIYNELLSIGAFV